MFPVTKEFQQKILDNPRQVFGKIQVDYTDPLIDQSIVMVATENANVSYPQQTADGVFQLLHKFASLDGSWVLDGTYALAPANEDALIQMGWWGEQLSDSNGNFSSPYPALSANFVSRPIVKLRVKGDEKRKEYPVDFEINLLNSDDVILYTEKVIGNNLIDWEKTLDSAITQVSCMVLTISKWSHPHRQVKIIEFYTLIQEVYEGKDLISFNLLEEIVASSNSLPIGTVSSNEISLKLNNQTRKFDAGNTQSPLHNQLKPNRRIKAWLGVEVPMYPRKLFGGRNLLTLSGSFDRTNIQSNDYTKYPIAKANMLEDNRNFVRVKRCSIDLSPTTFSLYNSIPLAYLANIVTGCQISISFEARGSINTNGRLMAGEYSPNKSLSDNSKPISISTEWQRYSTTFIVSEDTTGGFRICVYDANMQGTIEDFYVDMCHWKVEFGSIITPWTPAPEDLGLNYPDSIQYFSEYDLKKEFVPLGVFWSKDWNVPSNGVHAATSGLDRLSFVAGTYTSGELRNVTLYDLAADLFFNAGVQSEDYWIDPGLQNYVIPYVNFVNVDYKEVLRKIAEVCLGNVYCDRFGVIRVQGSKEISNTYLVETNGNADVSYPSQVTDKIDAPDNIYALLDGSWVLDGTQVLAPTIESSQIGWYSNKMSDNAGYFSEPYPIISLLFEAKAIESVKVVGDILRNEYPENFTITVYDNSNNVLSKQVIIGNTEVSTSIEIPENPTNATKITLTVQKWNKGNTQAKIIEFIDELYVLKIEPKNQFRKDNPAKHSEIANYIEIPIQAFDSAGEKLPITKVVARDEKSIAENGLLPYSLPVNDLIQTAELAQNIADKLLAGFKNPNRHLELEWRGNPALLLRDTVSVVDDKETNQYTVVRQELSYDGSLRAKLTGRKV
nr:MAG TPA: hypothetical protein [Caudoviricetes sp.]